MENTESFMPILFKVLFGFIILNIIINFILLIVKNRRMNKLLAIYWPVVLFVFIMQSSFQTGDLPVAMAYSVTILSMSIFALIGFEAIGRRFPWKMYLPFFALSYPVTILFSRLGYGFTTVAMPFAIVTAAPLIHAFLYYHIFDRKMTTRLQKVLGIVYLIMAVHCINFALFRMDPGAQLWGWLVAYAIYDMLAILLPSIALEEANLTENERLKNQVAERTASLDKSLKVNEGLLKILIHDISNPLTVLKFSLAKLEGSTPQQKEVIDKIMKSQDAINNILTEVKGLHKLQNSNQSSLQPVDVNECFKDLAFILSNSLSKKKIILKFINQLSANMRVLADRTTLTHCVLSNLVGNSLKFSSPETQIIITAKEEPHGIILEICDEGPGMTKETIQSVMQNNPLNSSDGTQGERGSGLGLSIVKAMVESYLGKIEFESNFTNAKQARTGTLVRMTLVKA